MEYMDLYTMIYNMCSRPYPASHSRDLYDKYKSVLEEYITSTALPAVRGQHGEFMLKELVKRWDTHKLMVRWLSRFFSYIDRWFTLRHHVPLLGELGIMVFYDVLFSQVMSSVRGAVLALVDDEREGRQIDRALLKNVLGVLVEIGMGSMDVYETDFEAFMLQDTAAYYSRKSALWMEEDTCSDYMVKAEECLKKEKERVDHYLHASSEEKLLQTAQHELLAQHQMQLLEDQSGCVALLKDDKVDDLSRMYRLFSLIPKGLEPMAPYVKQHVISEGTALVTQAEDAANDNKDAFVQKVIELHDKYLYYVTEVFANHILFHRSLKEAFEDFCNKKVAGSATAELLAAFCENLLRKGGTKLNDERIEDTLEKAVKLLVYVSDKDLFAEFYRKKLARRLMFNQSANGDHERSILSKLKQQHGALFTSKMEGMINDMELAREHHIKLAEFLNHKTLGMDMSVSPLTTTFWPAYKFMNLFLPAEMAKAVQAYEEYYKKVTRSRKLTWIYSMGTCIVKGNFDAKAIDLSVTPLQAAILLHFNDEDKLSYDHIKTQLNLTDEDAVRMLHSLSCAKYKILNKYPNTKTVAQRDTFEFNAKFTDKMRRIKIPMPPVDEKKKVAEDVEKDRRYAIDACIVRIMKSRKQLPHQQLVSETIEQCSPTFNPEIKVIKKRIEDLISREFIERDSENPTMFNYLT